MVQPETIKGVLRRDYSVLGTFKYDFDLILAIKRTARKSKFKDRVEFIEAQSRAREPINLELELRKAVIDHYFNKI